MRLHIRNGSFPGLQLFKMKILLCWENKSPSRPIWETGNIASEWKYYGAWKAPAGPLSSEARWPGLGPAQAQWSPAGMTRAGLCEEHAPRRCPISRADSGAPVLTGWAWSFAAGPYTSVLCLGVQYVLHLHSNSWSDKFLFLCICTLWSLTWASQGLFAQLPRSSVPSPVFLRKKPSPPLRKPTCTPLTGADPLKPKHSPGESHSGQSCFRVLAIGQKTYNPS